MSGTQIAANIVALIGTLIYCYGRFKKDKSNVLTYTLVCKFFNVLTYVILGTLGSSLTFLIHIPSLILAKIKVQKNKKWHALFILFELCYLLIAVMSFKVDGIVAILICIASSITLISNWYLSPQMMRLLSVPNSVIYFTFYFITGNYAGFVFEFLAIGSNIGSYLKYKKNS